MLRVLSGLTAIVVLSLAIADVFSTVVLARRSQWAFRSARYFYRGTWAPYKKVGLRIGSGRRRENYLSIFGPLSLLTLLGLWMLTLVLGFGLLHWSAGLKLDNQTKSLLYSFYYSAAGLFTVVTSEPQNTLSKILLVMEAGLGISVLALVVGYLPVLYQSFSSRELRILQLDARAGSPPAAARLLTNRKGNEQRLTDEFEKWEEWGAEILEAHTSYPMLAYFRSQHPNQSWLGALTSILDASALLILAADGDLQWQAQMSFAMGRHALADMTRHFRIKPHGPDQPRLSNEEFEKLQNELSASPVVTEARRLTRDGLGRLTRMYEPYAFALSEYFLIALPAWRQDENSMQNWRDAGRHLKTKPEIVSDPFRDPSHGENES